ncbi:hypothetical protein PGB90_005268 [Kerria lacca]
MVNILSASKRFLGDALDSVKAYVIFHNIVRKNGGCNFKNTLTTTDLYDFLLACGSVLRDRMEAKEVINTFAEYFITNVRSISIDYNRESMHHATSIEDTFKDWLWLKLLKASIISIRYNVTIKWFS